jgi:hypothetical protein
MKKLTTQEIWPLAVYESVRQDYRRQVIEHKKNRRIEVGPLMTFVFEDRITVKFQVQEILRAEKLSAPEAVAEELAGFNTMIPEDKHLSATLLISSPSEAEAPTLFATLRGLQDRVSLTVGAEVIVATFDGGRENNKKISAVQYLDFSFTEKAKQLLSSATCTLRVNHPHYTHATPLTSAVTKSLRQDL